MVTIRDMQRASSPSLATRVNTSYIMEVLNICNWKTDPTDPILENSNNKIKLSQILSFPNEISFSTLIKQMAKLQPNGMSSF